MKRAIIFWLTVFVLTIIVNSCGSRQAESIKKKETTKTDFSGFFRNSGNSVEFQNLDFNLQTDIFKKKEVVVEIENNDFTIEPEDISKPAIYIEPNGKKHVLINSKLTSKNAKQKSNYKTEDSVKKNDIIVQKSVKEDQISSEAQVRLNQEAAISEANKNSNRKQWSLWNLLWFFIPILVIIGIWKLYKKYKSKKIEV